MAGVYSQILRTRAQAKQRITSALAVLACCCLVVAYTGQIMNIQGACPQAACD
jgi:hypothetical protein